MASPGRAQGAPRPRRVTGHPYTDLGSGRQRLSSGGWELQTEKPLRRMRNLGPNGEGLLPREGPGDFRAVPLIRSDGKRAYHKSGPLAASTQGAYELRYRPRRNNLPGTGPEFVPYVYGASRTTRSFLRLDLEAIAAADREFDGRTAHRPFDDLARAEILELRAMHPKMPQYEIAMITGRAPVTVQRVLKAHQLAQEAAAETQARLAAAGGGRRIRPADLARIRGAA